MTFDVMIQPRRENNASLGRDQIIKRVIIPSSIPRNSVTEVSTSVIELGALLRTKNIKPNLAGYEKPISNGSLSNSKAQFGAYKYCSEAHV